MRAFNEYIIVLSLNFDEYFNWTRMVKSQFEIDSNIEFIVVDSKTAAIRLADKLQSAIIYNSNLFEIGGGEKAEREISLEQGKLLGEK